MRMQRAVITEASMTFHELPSPVSPTSAAFSLNRHRTILPLSTLSTLHPCAAEKRQTFLIKTAEQT